MASAPLGRQVPGDEDKKNDVESLLRLVRSHQRQHDDPAYESSAPAAIRRCKTMLTKLRGLLPKLMRPIVSLSAAIGVPLLRDLCELLDLLLRGSVCPHSMTLFLEGRSTTTSGARGNVAPQATASSYPTIATMIFYMVSFYSMSSMRDAQEDVLKVTLQMVLFLQRNDAYGFLHFFRDTVTLLEDCFLIEECLKDQEHSRTGTSASIACFLDTAMHVFQDVDGPLGAKSSVSLCGCVPVTDVVQLHERREQLKEMLPPLHVDSYDQAIILRCAITELVGRVICESDVMVANDPAFDLLSQMLPLFIERDAQLLAESSKVCGETRMTREEALDIADHTLKLLKTMLHASSTTERRFVRIASTFFECTLMFSNTDALTKTLSGILDELEEGWRNASEVTGATIWSVFLDWVPKMLLDHKVNQQIVSRMIGISNTYCRLTQVSTPLISLVQLVRSVDVRASDDVVQTNIVGLLHQILSAKSIRSSFFKHLASLLISVEADMNAESGDSGSLKRKRDDSHTEFEASGTEFNLIEVEGQPPHEKLSKWLVSLVFFESNDIDENALSLSLALRVIMPFRRIISTSMRTENYSIFRILAQRVEAVMNVYRVSDSNLRFTSPLIGILLVLLVYYEDYELAKHKDTVLKMLDVIRLQQFYGNDREIQLEPSRYILELKWKTTWQMKFMRLYQVKNQDHAFEECDDSQLNFEHYDVPFQIAGGKHICFQTVFLSCFIWSRYKALKVCVGTSWREAIPWQLTCRSILDLQATDLVVNISISMAPFLVFLFCKHGVAPPQEIITCLIELFAKRCQRNISETLAATIAESCGSLICAAANASPDADMHADNDINCAVSESQDCEMLFISKNAWCRCFKLKNSARTISIPISLFVPVFGSDFASLSEEIQIVTIKALATFFLHCEVNAENDSVISQFASVFLSALYSPHSNTRHVACKHFSALTRRSEMLDTLLISNNPNGHNFLEHLNGIMLKAAETGDSDRMKSVIDILGTLGCANDTQDVNRIELIIWTLLQLTSIWSKHQVGKLASCSVSSFDQIRRVTEFHTVTWRRMCVDYPEQTYSSLVDILLPFGTLKSFLKTFMGAQVDATAFLLGSAPFVLPKYVVDRNEVMLQAVLTEYNGTDEERALYEDGSEGDDFRMTTMTDLLLNHISYVLKEMIIHQMQIDDNQARMAEWEFLFKFLPENMTIRDVISHSPLRLLYLLAWELGGPRYTFAKKAFREVAKYLHKDHGGSIDTSDSEADKSGASMLQQYFLALMTELGGIITGNSSVSQKVRAIKSIDRLVSLFNYPKVDEENSGTSGIFDPFVPKVMATLKIGLMEPGLLPHAICAWSTFVRRLSDKALEVNFCSIVVTVLTCLGYGSNTVLHQEARASRSLKFWNVEILRKSRNIRLISESVTNNGVHDNAHMGSATRAIAFGILKFLFIEKKNQLKNAFPRIPLLPAVPEMDEIFIALESEVGDANQKSLGEFLQDLTSYINHWDMAVREIALVQLFQCLVVRGSEIQSLMQTEDDIYVDRTIVDIILSILHLARTENQESIKLLCARCLGALGAIDSARMPLTMFYVSGGNQGRHLSKDKVETRAEHSTKDLACVLIENWLVKELRAAPENTDSLGFAIQELLKFLAELTADPQQSGQGGHFGNAGSSYFKSRADSKKIMPDWMKRRFERKDVLQFVEPYWSTSYTLQNNRHGHHSSNSRFQHDVNTRGHGGQDDATFYEKYETSYEEWLLAWCKRLIHLSQPPERKIFSACQTVLPMCPQIARFLLPYLIQNVLRSGRSETYGELKKEVMAVLSDHDRGHIADEFLGEPEESSCVISSATSRENTGNDAPEKAFGEYSSRHHQCSQTIFSTIDELNEWVWNAEKKRLALSVNSSRQSSASASTTATASGRTIEIPSEFDDQEKENLEEFLKDIPSRSLSNAAYGIRAYARAIQYFEINLRQLNAAPPIGKEIGYDSSSGPVQLSLIAKNAFYLQQLYKSVDEPDALTGLATLRRLYDAHRNAEIESSTDSGAMDRLNLTDLMHQIVDHEQLAQWEDALACYEQAIQEIQSALSSRAFYSTRAQSSQRTHYAASEPHIHPELIKPDLYCGMIGCLIQLGRLESAIQHINGIITQEPEVMKPLYPYALECAWRLSRWELVSNLLSTEKQSSLLAASSSSSTPISYGGSSTRLRDTDMSQLMLVRVLHSLHGGEVVSFQRNLKSARLEVMGPLSAASAESYQRVYPLLHKLHFLHEAEQGFIAIQSTQDIEDTEERQIRWSQQCPWDTRFQSMAASLKFRDPMLALRRVLLQESNLRTQVSQNWLLYAKLARREGYIRTATSAVIHAEALDNPYALLEKAKLMVRQDRMYEALQILEPVDIDASKLDFEVEDPHYCAKTLLLATNWMQESGQRQGKKVIERYQAVIRFDPKWEKGYFFLAKYYEYLLSVIHPDTQNGGGSSSTNGDESTPLVIDSVFHSHLINLMKNYVLALTHGTKFVFQSMPRLLTLWFEYGETFYMNSGSKGSKVNKTLRHIDINAEQQILTEIMKLMNDATGTLPAYEWLVCFPQVISRICHPNPAIVEGVRKIIVKALLAYPTQAMWPIIGLSRSLNNQRRNRARDIISNTQRQLVSTGLQDVSSSFDEGIKLAEELITLAAHDPGSQRKIHIRLSRIRTKILVPMQSALTTILPASGLAPKDREHAAFSHHAQIYIKAFSDKADVMMTKEKPKRIEILGSDGGVYPFLCKREKTGDLRKDARMMEFNSMINKLLQKDREGQKRKLRLRTYAVVVLNEESGLMEWVKNTKAMRQLIGQIHKTERGFIQPVRLTHDIKERFLGMQKKYAENVPMMAVYYRKKILALSVFTPRFHQWFYNNFADPTAWFESRLVFSRSAAVWSMVGHVIGLGDRHGENILIDCTNGECVHVDFDCLFDKGLKLAKPEIVPFRLTPNMIDAFGITGYEGVFRRVSEVTMRLLRENKETLRSVLESFIHDPLVEWGRKGKATQGNMNDLSSDRSKEETRIILQTIDGRLNGIYNLGEGIRQMVSSSHRNILPENETLPLSVQGQVDKLIHEATSHENLAQMYIGWMPFL